jgi:putative addiction module killer protein
MKPCAPSPSAMSHHENNSYGQNRVYYALADKKVVLLCQGGDKRSQQADIDRAMQRWLEWQTRSST